MAYYPLTRELAFLKTGRLVTGKELKALLVTEQEFNFLKRFEDILKTNLGLARMLYGILLENNDTISLGTLQRNIEDELSAISVSELLEKERRFNKRLFLCLAAMVFVCAGYSGINIITDVGLSYQAGFLEGGASADRDYSLGQNHCIDGVGCTSSALEQIWSNNLITILPAILQVVGLLLFYAASIKCLSASFRDFSRFRQQQFLSDPEGATKFNLFIGLLPSLLVSAIIFFLSRDCTFGATWRAGEGTGYWRGLFAACQEYNFTNVASCQYENITTIGNTPTVENITIVPFSGGDLGDGTPPSVSWNLLASLPDACRLLPIGIYLLILGYVGSHSKPSYGSDEVDFARGVRRLGFWELNRWCEIFGGVRTGREGFGSMFMGQFYKEVPHHPDFNKILRERLPVEMARLSNLSAADNHSGAVTFGAAYEKARLFALNKIADKMRPLFMEALEVVGAFDPLIFTGFKRRRFLLGRYLQVHGQGAGGVVHPFRDEVAQPSIPAHFEIEIGAGDGERLLRVPLLP